MADYLDKSRGWALICKETDGKFTTRFVSLDGDEVLAKHEEWGFAHNYAFVVRCEFYPKNPNL